MNFANLAHLKSNSRKKIFAFQKKIPPIIRFLIVSKKQNRAILNEAQHSEESLHQGKSFSTPANRISVTFPEHLRCSSVPSKTLSFHHISVNFVIEYSHPALRIPHPSSFILHHTASKRMNFANLAHLKKQFKKKNLCDSKKNPPNN